jgi:hypothetical protein
LPVKSQRAEKTAALDASKASVELDPTLKQLAVKLKREGNPKLPVVRLYIGKFMGETVIRWHFTTWGSGPDGQAIGDVRFDHEAATQWLAKELSPIGVKVGGCLGYTAGSPEKCVCWTFKMH